MRRLPVIAKLVKLVGSKRSMTVSTSASGGPISTHARRQTGSISDTMSHPPHLLNHDILSAVLEHAETEMLLSLMLCCRALYQDGVRVLLAEPVCLDQTWEDPEKKLRVVWSFLEFMSADRRRWQSLRGLIMGHSTLYVQNVALLVEGIRQSPNIEHLELREADDLLSAYPALCAALASLDNVKHLRISRAAKHTCVLLESVQWPLVTAELAFSNEEDYWDNPDLVARMHPGALLRGAQNTLVRLECESWNGCKYGSGARIYPNVENLGMFDIHSMMPDEWVKMYPNVSQLSIFEKSFSMKGEIGDDEARYRSRRERNMHALADLDQCWPRLEEASLSCVADLYSLGLPCHIRSLKFFEAKWCLPFFPETMEYARPAILELSTHARYLGTFRTTFQQAALNGLRDLEQLRLTVRFQDESIDTDIPRSLLRGVNGIKLLPKLRTLTLRLDCLLSYAWGRRRRNKNHNPPADAERSLIAFDPRKFCTELLSLAPTLETVELHVDGMPQGMSQIDEQVQRTDVFDA